MKLSKDFTWMNSKQLGAPQMNGAPNSEGQLLQILDACLIDGFNIQTVTSVAKTASTVTLNFGVSHGYVDRQKVTVSGANDPILNGDHRIVSLTSNSITLAVEGVSVTTGAIKTKITPLGFETIFSNSDPLKRAYRSKNMQGTRTVLYLDMALPANNGYHATNPAKRAMVSMCEDMTVLGQQLNSYTDVKNNYDSNPNGSLFWYQSRGLDRNSSVTSSSNGSWVIFGNGDYFYFMPVIGNTITSNGFLRDMYSFGDIESLAGASDRYNCMWQGTYLPNDNGRIIYSSNGSKYGGLPTNSSHYTGFFIRDKSGTGDLVAMLPTADGGITQYSSGYTGFISTPNPTSGSLIGFPLFAKTDNDLRGYMPRILAIINNLANGNSVSDVNGYDCAVNGDLLTVCMHYGLGTTYMGYFGFDVGVG